MQDSKTGQNGNGIKQKAVSIRTINSEHSANFERWQMLYNTILWDTELEMELLVDGGTSY